MRERGIDYGVLSPGLWEDLGRGRFMIPIDFLFL